MAIRRINDHVPIVDDRILMISGRRHLGNEAFRQRVKLGRARQGGPDLCVETGFLIGLIMLARGVLPDHRAVFGRECHATGGVSANGIM